MKSMQPDNFFLPYWNTLLDFFEHRDNCIINRKHLLQAEIIPPRCPENKFQIHAYVYEPIHSSEKIIQFPADWFFFNPPEKIFHYLRSHYISHIKIYARHTECSVFSPQEALTFLQDHHPLNYARAEKWIGLMYQKNPVIMAGLNKPENNLSSKNSSYDMVRLCTRSDAVVIGGLKKILQHIQKTFPDIGDVFTQVDSGWASGKGLEKCGFIREKEKTFRFLVDIKKKKITPVGSSPDFLPKDYQYIRINTPVWTYRYIY